MTDDLSMRPPEGKVKCLAQFNKVNGVFVLVMSEGPMEYLNTDFYDYVPIEIDVDNEAVVGTRDDFKIVAIAELPTEISEVGMNALAEEKILKDYPHYQQLNVLSRAIKQIADSLEVEVPELEEMMAHIDEVKEANAIRKEVYAASPDFTYIDSAEEQRLYEQQFEGGAHEALGPRSLVEAI